MKATVENIAADVIGFLKNIGSAIAEVVKIINAFVCGIINGVIGLFQVILQVLAFLVDMNGLDIDYKSYLRRRDFGEKIESVLDFIAASFTSIATGIKNLFSQSGDITVEDIKNLLQSIGGFFESTSDAVQDFWQNTSRYKFAYWAGIFVFEVIINILLLVFTEGFGNVVKARSSFLKVLVSEAFSVATFGVVDILSFLKGMIGAFVKACAKGLKGFLRWIDSLLREIKTGKNTKNLDKLLEDIEKGADLERRIADLFDDLGGRLLTEKDLKLLKIQIKERYGVDLRLIDKEKGFEKLPVIKNGKTEWIRSSDLLKDWDNPTRNVVGKFHEGPPPVMILRSNNASELTVFHEKVHMEVWFNKLPKMHIVNEEKFVFEEIFKVKDKFNWTDAELLDAYSYVNKIINDYNELGKNFSKLNNEFIEQLKWKKQFNF